MERDRLLVVAPDVLAFGQFCLRRGDGVARGREPGVERFLALRRFGEPAVRVVRGGVEPLQDDQSFEISVHT